VLAPVRQRELQPLGLNRAALGSGAPCRGLRFRIGSPSRQRNMQRSPHSAVAQRMQTRRRAQTTSTTLQRLIPLTGSGPVGWHSNRSRSRRHGISDPTAPPSSIGAHFSSQLSAIGRPQRRAGRLEHGRDEAPLPLAPSCATTRPAAALPPLPLRLINGALSQQPTPPSVKFTETHSFGPLVYCSVSHPADPLRPLPSRDQRPALLVGCSGFASTPPLVGRRAQ